MTQKRTVCLSLAWRHFGVHTEVKRVTVRRAWSTLVKRAGNDPKVDELELLKALPVGFLPTDPKKILLMVDDTAVDKPALFRSWGKYFDAYSLTVERPA